jgi:MoxR-like ATPase
MPPTAAGLPAGADRGHALGRWFVEGLSPRAGIAAAARGQGARADGGRDYVAPDDVQAILPQTIAHRLVPVPGAGRGAVEQVRAMLEAVPIP